jgi:hypothetical protein
LRSVITFIAIAVEESESESAAISAARQGRPTARAPPNRSAAQAATCSAPPPNTLARMAQSRAGSSSRPITNSISTTPNSATCMIACTSRTKPRREGPIKQPATR